jgi:hypothetical protein
VEAASEGYSLKSPHDVSISVTGTFKKTDVYATFTGDLVPIEGVQGFKVSC